MTRERPRVGDRQGGQGWDSGEWSREGYSSVQRKPGRFIASNLPTSDQTGQKGDNQRRQYVFRDKPSQTPQKKANRRGEKTKRHNRKRQP